jgi:hypothetical protein
MLCISVFIALALEYPDTCHSFTLRYGIAQSMLRQRCFHRLYRDAFLIHEWTLSDLHLYSEDKAISSHIGDSPCLSSKARTLPAAVAREAAKPK